MADAADTADTADTANAGQSTEAAAERHASWLELFFDLIAVAGVAQLAHLLHGAPELADVGLYALLFLAFWTAWMCFTMYGNTAGDQLRMRTMRIGMFGLAVMAAAVPGVRENHAPAFAIAYVATRLLAEHAWRRRGEIVVDWPVAQLSLGVMPWVASIWCDAPLRYWLWAAGLLIDLGVTFAYSSSSMLRRVDAVRDELEERIEARSQVQKEEEKEEKERSGQSGRHDRTGPTSGLRGPGEGRGGPGGPRPLPTAARSDQSHLSERLGLFVLIVLGESVAQAVEAASEVTWDFALYGVAIGAFFLLLSLWSLLLRFGAYGVPMLSADALPARLILPLHCFTAGALAALAASLGDAVSHSDDVLPKRALWLMCGSMTLVLAIALLAGVCSGRDGRWRAVAAVTLLFPPVVALVAGRAGDWGPAGVVWLLVLGVHILLTYERRSTRSRSDVDRNDVDRND
ncbi:low temperature requirement protein A [Streptomyces beijiangensis]|uniref:Low temperature requirement protein A n=1 Tax=Streptomyces beijiangensis TaxID=163361 RepID=A0A939F9R7_9ACTN|nr:low temperature requirement protein A [Streptomyces beijiangensis]MBO0513075.1 low temperature requirement protein A [Streptomyces beijiangensis]